MSKTLFEKIWDKHVVDTLPDGTIQLYIDRLYCHEVTSPQAFAGLRARGLKPFRPAQITCMPDHNIPTLNQDKPIEDPISKNQVDTLEENAKYFGLTYYGLQHPKNGIIHVVGPETGLTQPGMTIVCGDSHTSTHGAMGAIAFGIGTSEVEMTLATQCIMQRKPKTMRITIDGVRKKFLKVFSEEFTDKTLNRALADKELIEYKGDVYVACKKRKGEASYNSCVDCVRDEGDGKFTVVIAVKMPPSGSKLYVDLPTEKNAAGKFVFSDYPYWEKSE